MAFDAPLIDLEAPLKNHRHCLALDSFGAIISSICAALP